MIGSENKSKNNECSMGNMKFLYSLTRGVRKIFILWLLSKEKMHGYAIMSKINETFDYMDFKVVHGSTIYPLLHSLEEEGLIQSFEEYKGNKKIKTYETTEEGIKKLNSIKKFIKSRPENIILTTYLNEMLFDDNEFTYGG